MKIIVSDLDKTYLDTRFESMLKMAKIPFENASDKRNIAGAAHLLRGLYDGLAASGKVNLTFLSASPPLIQQTITSKFRLDNLPVDALITKNLGRILLPGRWKFVRNHTLYKLEHLLQLAANNPEASFICLGDDWEYDLLAYCLFRVLLTSEDGEKVTRAVFEKMEFGKNAQEQLHEWMARVPIAQGRVHILLHRARVRKMETLRIAGDILAYDSYYQLMLLLYGHGMLQLPTLQAIYGAVRSSFSDEDVWGDVVSMIRHGMMPIAQTDKLAGLFEQVEPQLVSAVQRGAENVRVVPNENDDGLDDLTTRHLRLFDELHRKPTFDLRRITQKQHP